MKQNVQPDTQKNISSDPQLTSADDIGQEQFDGSQEKLHEWQFRT